MAHFAQLDDNNIVLQVVVISNDDIKDEQGNEVEEIGINFCKQLFAINLGENTRWVQTSYNKNFRELYAQPGYIYDPIQDKFINPIPTIIPDFPSENDLPPSEEI